MGNAGTADIGAIDDLASLADLARREKLWFHVDGAYGALAMLAPDLAPKLLGIERADSLAFDFHKWGQVPYDAGFILVRDGLLHRNAFATSPPYLGANPWPCRRNALAVRLRSRSFTRLPRVENLVHAERSWHGSHRIRHIADLLLGSLSGKANCKHAGTGTSGAGRIEHRLLPLPGG